MRQSGDDTDDDTYKSVIATCAKQKNWWQVTHDRFRAPIECAHCTVSVVGMRKEGRTYTSLISSSTDVGIVSSNVLKIASLMVRKVISVWDLFIGEGRMVTDIRARDVTVVVSAMGAVRAWGRIVALLKSKSTPGGGVLPQLNLKKLVPNEPAKLQILGM